MSAVNKHYKILDQLGWEFQDGSSGKVFKILASKYDTELQEYVGVTSIFEISGREGREIIDDLDRLPRSLGDKYPHYRFYYLDSLMKFSKPGSRADTVMRKMIEENPDLLVAQEAAEIAAAVPSIASKAPSTKRGRL